MHARGPRAALALSALLLGCSRGDGSASGDRAPSEVDPGIALSARVTEVVERDRGDCPRMGKDLALFLQENAAAVKAAKDAERGRSPAERAAFVAKHRAEIDALSRRLLPALEPCASSPAVAEAMRALPREPDPPVSSDKPL